MANTTNKPKLMHSQEALELLLRYEPNTGFLFWRERPVSMFSSARSWKSWNSRLANKKVRFSKDAYGYSTMTLFDKKEKVHQLVCRMVFGDYSGVVDHINGVR